MKTKQQLEHAYIVIEAKKFNQRDPSYRSQMMLIKLMAQSMSRQQLESELGKVITYSSIPLSTDTRHNLF